MKSKKNFHKNKELVIGGGICSVYLIWAFLWLFNSFFIKGSVNNPYFPSMNLKTELISPFKSNYILGTDIFGRSLFEILSAGLFYSISISLIVSLISCLIGLIIGYLSVNSFKYLKPCLIKPITVTPIKTNEANTKVTIIWLVTVKE